MGHDLQQFKLEMLKIQISDEEKEHLKSKQVNTGKAIDTVS